MVVPVRANEFGLTILEQHRDHLAKVGVQLVERRALAVRAGEAGNVADVEPGARAALDDGGAVRRLRRQFGPDRRDHPPA
jgi:hypothetical protein